MKHFIVEITFTAPIARIEEIVPQHRAFLQTGYDRGWLFDVRSEESADRRNRRRPRAVPG